MTESDRFHICLPFTLAQECPHPEDWSNARNFSNDAHDPGGETMCGIIQREYAIYRKSKGLPVRDVRQMTQDEGEEIYESSYWQPECPKLPVELDLCFFDEAVNAGPFRATKILQATLNIFADGAWGPVTDQAVKDISAELMIVRAYTTRRESFYRSLPGFKYFGTDWIRRSVEIGKEAEKMVS